MPKETHYSAALFRRRIKESAALQLRLISLIDALFCDVNPIPVKEAENLMGFAAGHCRLPLVDLSDAAQAGLVQEMKKVGLL